MVKGWLEEKLFEEKLGTSDVRQSVIFYNLKVEILFALPTHRFETKGGRKEEKKGMVLSTNLSRIYRSMERIYPLPEE